MKLVGDIHGNHEWYKTNVLDQSGSSLQLGDYGVGFRPDLDDLLNHKQEKDKAIGGNHDNILKLRKFQCYVGDWQYFPEKSLFVLGGANSPWFDVKHRTYNVNWWPTEELDADALASAYEAYCKFKPRYVVTHTAPATICESICRDYLHCSYTGGRTEIMLDFMLREHRPQRWWFGHWHLFYVQHFKGTEFRCVNVNEIVDVPELGEW